jgi:hypothetical protein
VTMVVSMTVSEIFRRSTLGTGCYVIRDDEDCGIPDAATTIWDAVIAAGACSVGHSGMYEAIERATALPGGYIYEMVAKYGFGGLPERSWVLGARSLRHIMRLLDLSQPHRRLSGETSIPCLSELTDEWNEFAHRDRLSRVEASLVLTTVEKGASSAG